ncbi:type I secretion C-terminal target domain-containing protein [Candidatus Ruthturnera calyptogenae]|uniref:type I secretion C-terminal target domain-containing protein n=1 Tax=Candidatus Ruthturnera calyptogenae TaxID=386487 RepID=UPI00046459E5|nr:type I secretion C-terminal target domain-containing protein [Candidatus Ruthturnera calyptogenae]
MKINNAKTTTQLKTLQTQAQAFSKTLSKVIVIVIKGEQHIRVIPGHAYEISIEDGRNFDLIAQKVDNDLKVLLPNDTIVVFNEYFKVCVSDLSCLVSLPSEDGIYHIIENNFVTFTNNSQIIHFYGDESVLSAVATNQSTVFAESFNEVYLTNIFSSLSIDSGEVLDGLLIVGLAGAGGGISSLEDVILKMVVSAGEFIENNGGLVKLYKYDPFIEKLTFFTDVDLNNSGMQDFSIGNYKGIIIAKLIDTNGNNADFRDEATGVDTDISATLLAVIDASKGGNIDVSITPLTTIAALRMGLTTSGELPTGIMLDISTISDANKGVAKAFGLGNDADVVTTKIQTVITQDGETSISNAYGNILAALSGVDSDKNSGNMAATITQFEEKLIGMGADLKLNTEGQEDLLAGASKAETSNSKIDVGLGLATTIKDTDAIDSSTTINITLGFEDTGISAIDNIVKAYDLDGHDVGTDEGIRINVIGVSSNWVYSTDAGINWFIGATDFELGTGFNLVEKTTTYNKADIMVRNGTDILAGFIEGTEATLGAGTIFVDGDMPSGITSTELSSSSSANFAVINISVTAGSTWRYSTENGADGTWKVVDVGSSFSLIANAIYTINQIQVKEIDAAGNESTILKNAAEITGSILALNLNRDTGNSIFDGKTNDAIINVITGPDVIWEYTINGGTDWTTGSRGNGSFELLGSDSHAVSDIKVKIAGQDDSNVITLSHYSATSIDILTANVDATLTLASAGDTGASSDNITSNKIINISGGVTWEYSTDGGENWIKGSDSSFELSSQSYVQGQIQVKQVDEYGNYSQPTLFDAITIDYIAPTITLFTLNTVGGSYGVNSNINITSTVNEEIASGTITVTLNTGETVILTVSADDKTLLTGNYIVNTGNTTTGLKVTSFTINSIIDIAGNIMTDNMVPADKKILYNIEDRDSTIVIDGVAPSITCATNPNSAQILKIGETLSVELTLDEMVTLTNAAIAIITLIIDDRDGSTMEVTATATGNGIVSNTLIFTTAALPNNLNDNNGVKVKANSLSFTSGEFKDAVGNDVSSVFTEISEIANTQVDTIAPTVILSGNIVPTANLTMIFDENIIKVAGKEIKIYKADGTFVEAVDSVEVTNDIVTINPATDLESNIAYYVIIAAGAFKDIAGNEYAGISESSVWTFDTASLSTTVAWSGMGVNSGNEYINLSELTNVTISGHIANPYGVGNVKVLEIKFISSNGGTAYTVPSSLVGTAITIDGSGNWVLDNDSIWASSANFTDGKAYKVKVKLTAILDNNPVEGIGMSSDSVVFDTVAPVTPNAVLITDSGSSSSDSITNNSAINAPVNKEIGATVEYKIATGSWSTTYIAPTTNGDYIVKVRQIDKTGNASSEQIITFTLDVTTDVVDVTSSVIVNKMDITSGVAFDADIVTPSASDIEKITVIFGNIQTGDNLLLDVERTLSSSFTQTTSVTLGIANVNYIYASNKLTITKHSGGSFSATEVESIVEAVKLKNTNSTPGDIDRTATFAYVDTAGNTGASAQATMTVVATIPTIVSVTDDHDQTGQEVTSEMTIYTVTFSHGVVSSFESNDVILVDTLGAPIVITNWIIGVLTEVPDSSGTQWTVSVTPPLGENTVDVTAARLKIEKTGLVDIYGNDPFDINHTQSIADAQSFDTQPPSIPTLTLNTEISAGTVTKDRVMNVTNLVADVASWQYSVDGGVSWTTVSDSSVTNFTLTDGTYGADFIRVKQTDNAGQTSNIAKYTINFSIDTAIDTPTFSPVDNGKMSNTDNFVLTFAESMIAVTGKNIIIKQLSDGSVIETIAADNSAQVSINATGVVTINPTDINLVARTSYYVEVEAGAFKDNAGNESTAITGSTVWNVIVNEMNATIMVATDNKINAIENTTDIVIAVIIGADSTILSTLLLGDFTVTITKVGGSVVSISGTAYDSSTGIWRAIINDGGLINGDIYTVQANITSSAMGINTSSTQTVTVGTNAPTLTLTDNKAIVGNDNVVNITESANGFSMTGISTGLTIGSEVSVVFNTITYTTTVTGASNNWSIDIPSTDTNVLIEGTTYIVTVNASDNHGNPATQLSQNITVDKTAPVSTIVIDEIITDLSTITGQTSANIDVEIKLDTDNNNSYDDATYIVISDANGNWTLDLNSAASLISGSAPTFASIDTQLGVQVNIIDTAGNMTTRTETATKQASSYSISDSRVIEGTTGTKTMTFIVTRGGDFSDAGTVDYAVNTTLSLAKFSSSANGVDDDYSGSTSGTVTFAVGERFKEITFTVNGDYYKEVNQNIIVDLTNPTEGAISKATGIGEIVEVDITQLAAAYSLKDVNSDLATNAVRVRRSSDNTELDIGFDKYDNLDTRALLNFVGRDTDDTGYVSIWYDQTGNGRDMAQTSSTKQGVIVSDGVVQTHSNGQTTIGFNRGLNGANDDFMEAIGTGGGTVTNLEVYVTYEFNIIRVGTLFNLGTSIEDGRIIAHAPWSSGAIYWDAGSSTGDARLFVSDAQQSGQVSQLVFTANYNHTGAGTVLQNNVDAKQGIFVDGDNKAADETLKGNSLVLGNTWVLMSFGYGSTVCQSGKVSEFLVYTSNTEAVEPIGLFGSANNNVFTYAGESALVMLDGKLGYDMIKLSNASDINLDVTSVSLVNIEVINMQNVESNRLTINNTQLDTNVSILSVLMNTGDSIVYESNTFNYSATQEAVNFGTTDNDIINMSSFNETVYGRGGNDTFVYKSWSDAAASSSADSITDFTIGMGADKDILNLKDLLTDYDSTNLADFINLSQIGGNTIISVDKNGAMGDVFTEDINITLTGVTEASLVTMINDGNLVLE